MACGIDFINLFQENDTFNILQNEYIYNGAGVAVGDLNNDGLPELFFTGNQVSAALYLNTGGLTFKNITGTAGVTTHRWATGVTMADVNADGWLDIYVSCAGHPHADKRRNYLFINQHDLTFVEQAAAYHLDFEGYTTHAAFFDYDLDGDLDVYLLNHSNKDRDPNYIKPQARDGSGASTDKLFRNDGGIRFSDASAEAGITVEGYGLGVVVTDVNKDGWPDLYVANDYVYNDVLYINLRNGTFRDELKDRVTHTSQFAMGTDAGDVNNDAFPDIFVADMLPPDNLREKTLTGPMDYDRFQHTLRQGYVPQYMRNTLQVNDGGHGFIEVGQLAGVHETDWSWSPLLADFDNDGYNDLLITNGYYKNVTDRDFTLYTGGLMAEAITKKKTYSENKLLMAVDSLQGAKLQNYVFKNNGDLTFTECSHAWGISEKTFSHGAVYADLDRDGDLDIAINNLNDEALIYQNTTNEERKSFVSFSLRMTGNNTFAVGARIEIETKKGLLLSRENNPSRGYQSAVEPVLHFTFPSEDSIHRLTVFWPNGTLSWLSAENYNMNEFHTIHYDSVKNVSSEHYYQNIREPKAVMERISPAAHGMHYKHKESEYVEFKVEPLLPYPFSRHAPPLAVADVTGDALDDFYVGASSDMPGALYVQHSSGMFKKQCLPASIPCHETDVLFFDADNDGDKDIYNACGGNEYFPRMPNYQDRLFVNDGTGQFTLATSALPDFATSTSCVEATDYDLDGDLDLFVGGMIEPFRYPLPPDSYILQNNGGRFTDITAKTCPELKRFGLVKQAQWVDVNQDKKTDLVIAGEYLPITVFLQQPHGTLWNATTSLGLAGYVGWWQSVHTVDVDADGDMDIIAGNLGLNHKLKATEAKPLTLVANDFDKNASLDAITARYYASELYPIASRDRLLEQVPSLKKKFLFHRDYAKTTLKQMLDAEFKKSYVREATEMRSGVFVNTNGRFTFVPFPSRAQGFPIQSIKLHQDSDLCLAGGDKVADNMQGNFGTGGLILIRDFKNCDLSSIQNFLFLSMRKPIREASAIRQHEHEIIMAAIRGDSLLLLVEPPNRYSKSK